MDDVMPFLENVLRGKNVPPERMRAVAAHYEHFGGVSPINDQSRALLSALRAEFDGHGLRLPVYWGNRNWPPMLADTLRQMTEDGVTRAIAFVPSAFSSYSGLRPVPGGHCRGPCRGGGARPASGQGAGLLQSPRVHRSHDGPGARCLRRGAGRARGARPTSPSPPTASRSRWRAGAPTRPSSRRPPPGGARRRPIGLEARVPEPQRAAAPAVARARRPRPPQVPRGPPESPTWWSRPSASSPTTWR